ncbi:MAG: hypothetical protein A3G87_04895 [Omnitrophica bacterium RIFCSPLOWO2_12_FULL_50_11]|nr:MAG: hypothetical protein A3G87_04895 [Omnitrophica bacterium RIFCSPLOWO2_12_FULL_50_11]
MHKPFRLGLILALFLAVPGRSAVLLAEQEIAYDAYVPLLKRPEAVSLEAARKRDRSKILARVVEQPFRPFGHSLGKTAEWVERKHVDEKVVWFFDELALHGIHPSFRRPTEGSFGTAGVGGRVDIEQLLEIEQPYMSSEIFGGWTPNAAFDGTTTDFGGKYRLQAPEGKLHHEGFMRYARSSSESFYGIGNDSSLGEWSSYEPEELMLKGSLAAELTRSIEANASVLYQRMNIGNGARKGVGKIKEHFLGSNIPGIAGGNLIGVKGSVEYDVRDHATDPRKGGYGALEVSYFHDTDSNDFQYVDIGGFLAHFFRLGSDRRVLALRLTAKQVEDVGGDDIPFFNLARLGGSRPWRGSELLRSYRFNRFFADGLILGNAEYRYNIYEYGDFAGDAFALFDVGEVSEDIVDFAFGELEVSYGGGVNLKFRRETIFSFVVAHGSEGTEFTVHSRASF